MIVGVNNHQFVVFSNLCFQEENNLRSFERRELERKCASPL